LYLFVEYASGWPGKAGVNATPCAPDTTPGNGFCAAIQEICSTPACRNVAVQKVTRHRQPNATRLACLATAQVVHVFAVLMATASAANTVSIPHVIICRAYCHRK